MASDRNTQDVLKPINGETKTAWLLDQLTAAVVSSPIGARFLSDRAICLQYGISQPIVRSAMTTLVCQGLIRRDPGRGSFVKAHIPTISRRESLKITVFTCLGEHFFPHHRALSAIEHTLRRNRHELIVRANDHNVLSHLDQVALMIDDALRETDGVIWVAACSQEAARLPALLRSQAKRMVFVNLRFYDHGASAVIRDDQSGAFELTRHLIQRGHRNIGYIGGPEARVISQARYRGFCLALEKAGITPDPQWVAPFLPTLNLETGYRAMQSLLSLPQRPTACVCMTDVTAYGALEAIQAQGLKAPDDMALTGFDNVQNPIRPVVLTTADLAFEAVGQQAALQLTGQIEDVAKPGALIYVPCPIQVRASTVAGAIAQTPTEEEHAVVLSNIE